MTAFATLLASLSPSLYWPLDSINGITDQSGNGRNGTALGTTPDASEPLADGAGGSTLLDGIDDAVNATYNPYVNGAARTFGMFAWRRVNTAQHALLGHNGIVGDDPNWWLTSGADTLNWSPDPNGGTASSNASSGVGTGQWAFAVLVFNEATNAVEQFVNGASLGALSNATAYGAGASNLSLGRKNNNSGQAWFDGKLAHFFVVESALSATNIADLSAAAGVPPPPALPILPTFPPSRFGPF